MTSRFLLFFLLLIVFCDHVYPQGSNVEYPYEVKMIPISLENDSYKMAYMDVLPANSNGHTVTLLHGKNFNGYYWKEVIESLVQKGYRVVVPDQIGWGKSEHPATLHYSFTMLANNTKLLLASLGIKETIVLAHSMGGMLGTRFTLMYPELVEKLVLENPIGLEDYKTFVPYRTVDQMYQAQVGKTYEDYKNYQKTYYPVWKDEYEDLVRVQASALKSPDFKQIAFVDAVTYDMIYNEPVCYEFPLIKVPTLLIIGQADRTIVGKVLLNKGEREKHGQYPYLGNKTAAAIPNAKIVKLEGVGHIPHIQSFSKFEAALLPFLQ